jgi:hypothetical protein
MDCPHCNRKDPQNLIAHLVHVHQYSFADANRMLAEIMFYKSQEQLAFRNTKTGSGA